MKIKNLFKRRDHQQSSEEKNCSSPKTAGERAFEVYTKSSDVEEYVIPLPDDQFFQVNSVALFSTTAPILKNFIGEGLPRWAVIDSTTGIISGTVSHDASVFGRSKVTVTAQDEHQNEVTLKLVLSPQNLAAIADTTVHDCEIDEGSMFNLNLESLFYDPFSEFDPSTVCVNGLPQGLSFEAESNSVLGEVPYQTANRVPYVVTVWARGSLNRLKRQHFLLKIATPLEGQQDLENALENNDRRSEIRANNRTKLRNSLISKGSGGSAEVENTESVWESGEIKGNWGIKMPAKSEFCSVDSFIPDDSEIDWTETVASLKQKQERHGLSKDDRLNRISIDAMRRQDKLYLEFQSSLDAARDGQVRKTSIRGEGGAPLPEWMTVVRDGFIIANPPPDIQSLDIELNVVFGNGYQLVKPVRVNL